MPAPSSADRRTTCSVQRAYPAICTSIGKVAPAIIANLAGVDEEHRAARHVSQKHIQVLIQHPLRGAKPAVTSM